MEKNNQDLQLKIIHNTFGKPGILQSSSYEPSQLLPFSKGLILSFKSYNVEGNHVRVNFRSPDRKTGRDHHYFYVGSSPHIEFVGNIAGNDPSKEAAKRNAAIEQTAKQQSARADKDRGERVYIIGLGYRYLNNPIDGTRNFYWYEALRNGARMPDHAYQALNIVHVAKRLQAAKDGPLKGASMIITSWLRPAAINRSVGGSTLSTHVSGSGVDWYVPNLSESEVYRRLNAGWEHGLAIRPGSFVHTDTGRDAYDRLMSWKRRWSY